MFRFCVFWSEWPPVLSLEVKKSPVFLYSLTYKQRKYWVWFKFSKWRFWWVCTFWGLLNLEITFLAFSLCVCVFLSLSLCVCVFYKHNTKTNYSRVFKFDIIHLYHKLILLETFYKDRSKTLCAGAHKSIRIL